MKVLHIISGSDPGGAKTHVLRLLQHPEIREYTQLACLGDGILFQEAKAVGIDCFVVGGNLFAQREELERRLSKENYSILHCHGARANLLGASLRGKTKAKILSTIHSDHRLDYLGKPLQQISKGTLNALALRRMDALECVSLAMAQTYHRRGFPFGKIYSIFNGVPEKEPDTSREEHPDTSFVIGALSRMDKVKDLATLLRGFALAVQKHPELRLKIGGTGKEEKALRKLTQELHIQQQVEFCGWIQVTDKFYRSLDAFAITSLSETFPYAVTGAAQIALPVIATAVGGLPELIEPEVTGLLIPPRDPRGLSDAIEKILTDDSIRLRMGAALQQKVKKEFSLNAMAKRQKAIYENMVKPGRRGVMIAGACGQGNIGDEAMLSVILHQIREADEAVPVAAVSRNSGETEKNYPVFAIPSKRPTVLYREMKSARLFLSGGGNLLQDVTSSRSLQYYLWQIRRAKKAGCTTALYGAGIGPLSENGTGRAAESMKKYLDWAAFRESESLHSAEKMGFPADRSLLISDPALGYSPGVKNDVPGLPKDYITVCLRTWKGTEKAREKIIEGVRAYAEESGCRIVFLPMNRKDSNAFPLNCSTDEKEIRLPFPGNPEQAVSVLTGSQAVISMRLHALVLAAARGIPTIGISCDGRISAFAKEGNIPFFKPEEVEENPLPIQEALRKKDKYIIPDVSELKTRLQTGGQKLKQELN